MQAFDATDSSRLTSPLSVPFSISLFLLSTLTLTQLLKNESGSNDFEWQLPASLRL